MRAANRLYDPYDPSKVPGSASKARSGTACNFYSSQSPIRKLAENAPTPFHTSTEADQELGSVGKQPVKMTERKETLEFNYPFAASPTEATTNPPPPPPPPPHEADKDAPDDNASPLLLTIPILISGLEPEEREFKDEEPGWVPSETSISFRMAEQGYEMSVDPQNRMIL